ncbi:hypothetical protein HDU76_001082 [Blyttiomyces sp. JEL0837]|nr:hypothetical protein HDU76_001082 [Blyttiomyces sp. JEL0837]
MPPKKTADDTLDGSTVATSPHQPTPASAGAGGLGGGGAGTGASTAATTTAPGTRQGHSRTFHGIHTIHHSQFTKQEMKETNLPSHIKQLIIEASPTRHQSYEPEKVTIRSENRFASRDPKRIAMERAKRRMEVYRSGFCSDAKEPYRPLGDPTLDSDELLYTCLRFDPVSFQRSTNTKVSETASKSNEVNVTTRGKIFGQYFLRIVNGEADLTILYFTGVTPRHNNGFTLIKQKLVTSKQRLHAVRFGIPFVKICDEEEQKRDRSRGEEGANNANNEDKGDFLLLADVSAIKPIQLTDNLTSTLATAIDWNNLKIDTDKQSYYMNVLEKNRQGGSPEPRGRLPSAQPKRGWSPTRRPGQQSEGHERRESVTSAASHTKLTVKQMENALGIPSHENFAERAERFFLVRDKLQDQKQILNQILSEDLNRMDHERKTEFIRKFKAFQLGKHASFVDEIAVMRQRAAIQRKAEKSRILRQHPWFHDLVAKVKSKDLKAKVSEFEELLLTRIRGPNQSSRPAGPFIIHPPVPVRQPIRNPYPPPPPRPPTQYREPIYISSPEDSSVPNSPGSSRTALRESSNTRHGPFVIDDEPVLHKPNSPIWKQKLSSNPMNKIKPSSSAMFQHARVQHEQRFAQVATGFPNGIPLREVEAMSGSGGSFGHFQSGPMAIPGVGDYIVRHEVGKELQMLLDSIPDDEEASKLGETPSDLLITLLRHQLQGLGKTIQALSLMLSRRGTGETKTNLIVAPLALVKQWEEEIKTKAKTGSLSVLVHHGPNRTKDPAQIMKHDVVITTYAIVTSDLPKAPKKKKSTAQGKGLKSIVLKDSDDEDGEDIEDSSGSDSDSAPAGKIRRSAKPQIGPLFRCKFWRVILDEAQTIKNHKSRGATACCELQATYRLCLTGTPLQNSVEELYSLLKFLQVKPYDDFSKFKAQIAGPISQSKPGRANVGLRRLKLLLGAIMLRRTKFTMIDGKPLLNLPEKKVELVSLQFSETETTFYGALNQRIQDQLQRVLKNDQGRTTTSLLSLLLRLRQACNHPQLVGGAKVDVPPTRVETDSDIDDIASVMAGLSVSKESTNRCSFCLKDLKSDAKDNTCEECEKSIPLELREGVKTPASTTSVGLERGKSSTKIEKLLELLKDGQETKPGEKWIIFSQFTSMLDLIEGPLREKGYKFVRYDGSMRPAVREKTLHDFKNDPSITICLISLMCGSVGLNLTCANNVVLVDMWWNPLLEAQAIDRVHRIGQTRPVRVWRLAVAGTVEDRIIDLQNKKMALVDGALGSAGFRKANLTTQELLSLFNSN